MCWVTHVRAPPTRPPMPAATPLVRIPRRRPAPTPPVKPPGRVVVGRRRAVREVRPRLLDRALPLVALLLPLASRSAEAAAAVGRAAVRGLAPGQ